MGLFTFEVLVNAAIIVILPIFLIVVFFQLYLATINPQTLQILLGVFVGIFTYDYLLTLIVVFKYKKPIIAIYGLGFLFFRYLDSLILLISFPQGLLAKSHGRWKPPKRN